MNTQLRVFESLTDTQLLEEVHSLVARHRDITAALIAALAEVDSRRLYLAEGFSSLVSYCTDHLHLSEHEAYSRMESARIARRFPIVLDMLASGELTMTTVNLLGDHLTDENHLALLQAARYKSKREVQEQLGALRPQPDVWSTLTPLGDDRYKLQVMLSGASYETLRRLQDLMRHTIPDGDPAEIVARALSLLLMNVERQRLAAVRRPKRPAKRAAHSRYVPAAIKREVYARDGGQCTFVGAAGRCQARGFLEWHHVKPFSEGGATTVDNLQLRCRAHNNYEAAQQASSTG